MGTKKKFTPEELKHLQANPYTLRVYSYLDID